MTWNAPNHTVRHYRSPHVHPWAILQRHGEVRRGDGVTAGIITGGLYAVTSVVVLALTGSLGYGSALWWLAPEVAIGLWLLPSAAKAALGSLEANMVRCCKP